MGLASALSTALTGMTAAETTIDVVGNNLANSSTVGFKASSVAFATQFLQTQSLGSAPTQDSGGTNPRQTGLGTMVAEIAPNFTQGTIEVSGNQTDMAIQGDGFFIVEGSSGEQLYSRNGIFKMNSANEMVTITGNRLLGFGVDDEFDIQTTVLQPIQIPLGAAAVAQPTQNVYLEGTLLPTGDLADTAEIIQTERLGDMSYSAPLNNVDAAPSAQPNVTGPPPTTLNPEPGGGLTAGGTYSYRIVFADGLKTSSTPTEGAPSIPVGPQILDPGGANQTIRLDDIPLNLDYSYVRIYRTLNGGSTYYYVNEVAMPGATFYIDTATDASINNPLNELNEDVLNDTGSYSYYVTFADVAGGPGVGGLESRPYEQYSTAVAPGNVGRLQLSNLPVDASGDWAVRRIYRNLSNDSSTFYYVGEINDVLDSTLTYTDNKPDDSIDDPTKTIDLVGPKITAGTLLTEVERYASSSYNPVFQQGTLAFTGKKGGRMLATKELQITATTNVLDLVDFMEEAMGIEEPGADPLNPIPGDSGSGSDPGAYVTTDGQIRLVGNNGVDNAVEIGLSGLQLTTATGSTDNISMPFGSVQSAVGESAATDFLVYDTLGIPLRVRLTAVMESQSSSSTTYRWFADSSDNDPATGVGITVGTGLITFDGEGGFTSATEATVSIDRANVSSVSPLEFELDFSQLSGLAADSSSLAVTGQDGSGPGVLTNFIVGEDGRIRGVFSNGITRDLGQIRLARFGNPAGLEQKGENFFTTGVNSGLPLEGNPGERGLGTLIAGAVELSNTDIGSSLIDLILASTMYRGNTRVITTAQQMLDELLALRR